MLHIAFLGLLTIILYFFLDKTLKKSLSVISESCDKLNAQYIKSQLENDSIKKESAGLDKIAQENIALFDLTKDICRSLDENKLLALFKENVNKYIDVKDCLLLKPETNLADYSGFITYPLVLNKNNVGHLAISGIREQDKEKFHILGQQFLLGLGRSLLYKKVQSLTIIDGLTQVYSRRYFLEKVEEEISRSRKFNLSFSFLMIDIDNFKKINDNYGHLVGDVVLKEVAKSIKDGIRQIDFMGRFGGEELSVILTETDKNEALLIAERLREAVESNQITAYDESLNGTISIGISIFPSQATEMLALIDKADLALYQAKQSGKNKVAISS